MAKKKRLRQQLSANGETVNKDVKSGGNNSTEVVTKPIKGKPVNTVPSGPFKKSEKNVQPSTSGAVGTSGNDDKNTSSSYDDVFKIPASTVPETSTVVSNGKPTSSEVTDEAVETQQQTRSLYGKRLKDPKIIPRIMEYLENRTNKKGISFCAMTDYLQSKYPEYRRKKRTAFKIYVEKAYSMWASENFESEDSNSSSEVDTDIDDPSVGDGPDVLKEYKDTNAMNNMMANMYKSSPSHSGVNNSDDRGTKRKHEDDVNEDFEKNKEKIIYPSPNALERNLSSTGLVGPRRTQFDKYFIDRKGDNVVEETKGDNLPPETRETTIQKFLGALPSRTSYSAFVNSEKDSSRKSGTLYRVFVDNKKEDDFNKLHSGVTDDNMGVTDVPPSSPEPAVKQVKCSANQNIPDPRLVRNQPIRTEEFMTETPKSDERLDEMKSLSKTPRKVRRSRKPADMDMDLDKNTKKDIELQKSTVTFADVGGNDKSLIEICKLLVHMRHPEVYQQLGVTPPRGFLLHGPPGCGKTLLANAIAGELDLPILKFAATEIVSGVSGDSEAKIRDLFEKAQQNAPCIMFIDEIDSITPKRETASKDMERRIVAQLLACMDDLNANPSCHVLVIGATNRADSLDPALRRAGRFDREISLGIPDELARFKILQVLCRGLRLQDGFDFRSLAHYTPGYVGADLMALTREAAITAVNRVFQELQSQPQTDINVTTPLPVISSSVRDSHDLTAVPSVTHTAGDIDVHSMTSVTESVTINCSQAGMEEKTDFADGGLDRNGCLELIKNGASNDIMQVQSSEDITVVNQHVEVMDTTEANSESVDGIHAGVSDTNSCVDDSAADNSTELSEGRIETQEPPDGLNSAKCNIAGKGNEKVSAFNDPPITRESELLSVLSWLKEHPPLTESQLQDLYITVEDFKEALKCVQPSAKREGFATVPDVTWDDIGALKDIREELQLAILAPVRHPEQFQSLGLTRAQGVLLAGPPGCGKTLLAKAVANESGINFISVKGPELLNMYVGESERAVRTVFQRARNSAPCVIFFDELDALCPKRSGHSEGNSSARVVNQLLTEMDGLEERRQVYIMAATNRPDIIDPAVLRPGRLDKTLYVGLPCMEDRLDILNTITKVKLNDVKRCVMVNYHSDSHLLDFRHYNIKVVPVGMSRGVKKLVQSKVPNLGKYGDISEYMTRAGYSSESEVELDGPMNEVVLPQNIRSRGNIKSAKSAVRLTELGPRLTLELVKIEEGICEGQVMYHAFVTRTEAELAHQRALREKKRNLKEARRQQQAANVARKEKEKGEHKERSLEGFKRKVQEQEGASKGDEGVEEPEMPVVDDGDDDVEYFKQEVGQMPDEDSFIPGGVKRRKQQKSTSPAKKKKMDSSDNQLKQVKDRKDVEVKKLKNMDSKSYSGGKAKGDKNKQSKRANMTPMQKIMERKKKKKKLKEKKMTQKLKKGGKKKGKKT